MSFQEKYDKIFLITGCVLGAGVIAFGASLLSDAEYGDTSSIRDKKIQIPGIAKAESLETSIKEERKIARPKNGPHHFDMFVGPILWQQKNKLTPIDIDEEGAIHPPVPNSWFIEMGLKDDLKYSDALTRDPDNDGFTILEEYKAETDPTKADSHPLLIVKLAFKHIKKRAYSILFSSDYPPEYSFKATNASGAQLWSQTVKQGELLGIAITDANRFLLKEVTQKEFVVAGTKSMDSVAILEDQKPTKQGVIYEIRKGSRYAQAILDNTAVFAIMAGSQSGEEVSVEEGAKFKIPGDEQTEYTLESIDNQGKTATIKAIIESKERTWQIQR